MRDAGLDNFLDYLTEIRCSGSDPVNPEDEKRILLLYKKLDELARGKPQEIMDHIRYV
jgi:hypothetical protein